MRNSGGRQTQRVRTNLSLRSIRRIGSLRDKDGLPANGASKLVKHRALVLQAASYKQRREARLQEMTANECKALEGLRNPPTFPPGVDEDFEDLNFNFGDVCDGTDTLPISHAGGEFEDLARGVMGEVWRLKDRDNAHRVQHIDNRTRRDRVLRRNVAFNEQIQVMSEAYLIWSLEKSQKGFRNFFECLRSEETDEVIDFNAGQWPVTVIDAFFAEKVILKISSMLRPCKTGD
ncbi:hypothetical protein BDR07DRAFT_1489879 [Suillus spraguei]|nr:hypothetical protein BDR07DRAFT_1489879 [Suillus spraguei]